MHSGVADQVLNHVRGQREDLIELLERLVDADRDRHRQPVEVVLEEVDRLVGGPSLKFGPHRVVVDEPRRVVADPAEGIDGLYPKLFEEAAAAAHLLAVRVDRDRDVEERAGMWVAVGLAERRTCRKVDQAAEVRAEDQR